MDRDKVIDDINMKINHLTMNKNMNVIMNMNINLIITLNMNTRTSIKPLTIFRSTGRRTCE